MKKTKSSIDKSIHDKQYDATLYSLKVLAAILTELKELTSQIKEHNLLVKDLLASCTLEEESV